MKTSRSAQAQLLIVVSIAFGSVLAMVGDRKHLSGSIVVERVGNEGVGAKVGLKQGDILSAWSCGNARHSFDSPFDVILLELTQDLCKHKLVIQGVRNGEFRMWVMSQDEWDVTVRPAFSPLAVVAYEAGLKQTIQGNTRGAAASWGKLRGEHDAIKPWFLSWLHFDLAGLLGDGGFLSSREGQMLWDKADAEFRTAAEHAPKGLPSISFLIRYAWGDSYLKRDDFKNSAASFLEASREAQRMPNSELLAAICLEGMGTAALRRDDLKSAEEYFHHDLNLAEVVAASSTAATAYHQLGVLSLRRGDLAAAERYFRRSVETAAQVNPDSIGYAKTVGNLGAIFLQRGELARAEESYLRALAVVERLSPESYDVAACLHNLGRIAEGKGDLAAAKSYFERAWLLETKTVPGTLSEANTVSLLGTVLLKQGNIPIATKHLYRALSIRKRLSPRSLGFAASLSALGDLALAQGKTVAARTYYQQALTLQELLAPGSMYHADALVALARLAREQRQFDPSIKLYERALATLETQTSLLGGSDEVKSEFRASHASVYEELISSLIATGQRQKAFEVMERSRAHMLLQNLAAGRVEIHNGVPPQLLERRHSLQMALAAETDRRIRVLSSRHTREELAAVDKRLSEVLVDIRELDSDLRRNSPRFASLAGLTQVSFADVRRQVLDADTVLLEYSLGNENSYLFAVSRRAFSVHDLPGRAAIENLTRRWYDLLKTRDNGSGGEIDRIAADLSRIVLGPVAREIRGKRLLIVADGGLQYIPFGALPAPRSGRSGRDGVPLVVEHEIVHLPSATVLGVLRREHSGQRRPDKAIAVFADPVFSRQDVRLARVMAQGKQKTSGLNSLLLVSRAGLPESSGLLRSETVEKLNLPRLYFTREEARAILASAPQAQEMVAVDFAANRARVIGGDLAHYRIVHFATHTLLDTTNPELSGLVLSLVDEKGMPVNGFVGLEDIYNLELSADLVVLSACETALGKEIAGEGLVGLTRGFMHAGASRVIASLWRVDDAATSQLMAWLYEGMEKDGMRPAAALRSAQIKMIAQKKSSWPFFWAAFEIQGEWQ